MSYKVPKGEEGFIHASIFSGARLDSDTGEPTKRVIMKTIPRQFEDWLEAAPKLGYRVEEILSCPKDYNLPEGFKTAKEVAEGKKAKATTRKSN